MISIETKGSKKQFNFGVWFGHAKLIAERLKMMMEYSEKPTSLQQVYNTIHSMTMEKMPSKSKTPTQQVTTSRTLFTTLTPITVQAANNSDHMYNSNASSGNSVVTDMTENRQPVDDQVSGRASPAQGALNAAYQAALSKRRSAPVMRVSLSPETQPPTEAWPGDVPKPSGAVACGCSDHLDKVEADMTLPISAKELFELMFIKTKLWCELNKNKKYGEPSFTEWEKNSRGQKERIVTYMMPVSMPMGKF